MRIPISEIKINPGRLEADPAHNETLHPETFVRNRPGHVNNQQSSSDNLTLEPRVKSFVEDTAEKLGVSTRTVEHRLWLAEHLSPKAMGALAARFTEAR